MATAKTNNVYIVGFLAWLNNRPCVAKRFLFCCYSNDNLLLTLCGKKVSVAIATTISCTLRLMYHV